MNYLILAVGYVGVGLMLGVIRLALIMIGVRWSMWLPYGAAEWPHLREQAAQETVGWAAIWPLSMFGELVFTAVSAVCLVFDLAILIVKSLFIGLFTLLAWIIERSFGQK